MCPKSPKTCGLQALGRIEFAKPHDAQRGSKAQLGVRAALENLVDEFLGVGSVLRSPTDDPLGSPFEVFLMEFGTVL